MQGNTPSLQDRAQFKKERVLHLEGDQNYFTCTSSPFLFEISNKTGSLFFASKSKLCMLPYKELRDFLAGVKKSFSEYDLSAEANRDITMIKLSSCERYLAVMFPFYICVIYLPNFLKTQVLQAKLSITGHIDTQFRYLEWPPLNDTFLSDPYLLTMNSDNILSVHKLSGNNDKITSIDKKFNCATFSSDGEQILAIDEQLQVLDAFTLNIKRSIQIPGLSKSSSNVTSIAQLTSEIVVIGSMGEQGPKMHLLLGNFLNLRPKIHKGIYDTSMKLSLCRNILLYSHSHANTLHALQVRPDKSLSMLDPMDLGKKYIRGFEFLRTQRTLFDSSTSQGIAIQDRSAFFSVSPKLLVLNSEGMLDQFILCDGESAQKPLQLIKPITYDMLDQTTKVPSLNQRGNGDQFKPDSAVNKPEESKSKMFNRNKKSKMMEDGECGGRPLKADKRSELFGNIAAGDERKSKKRARMDKKNTQEEEFKIERSGAPQNNTRARAFTDTTTRVPGREYYKIKGFRPIAPSEEDDNQVSGQIQLQNTIMAENPESNQANELPFGLRETDTNIQSKDASTLTTNNAIANMTITQDRGSAICVNPFLPNQPNKEELIRVQLERLETKKNIFQKSFDLYPQGIEELKSISKETEELTKIAQEILKNHKIYLDENEHDLLKEAFKASAMMGNVLASVMNELEDEKDVFIAIDLEDEDRIEIEKTVLGCARQMSFIDKKIEILQDFKRKQERIMTLQPNYKPRMIEYDAVDRKKILRLRKEENLKLKRKELSNLDDSILKNANKLNCLNRQPEENDNIFRLRELFKLVVNESTLTLQEMKTRIVTLRNQSSKVQESLTKHQTAGSVDERSLSVLSSSQCDTKEKLFQEILVLFADERKATGLSVKKDIALKLKNEGDDVSLYMCSRIKMPLSE